MNIKRLKNGFLWLITICAMAFVIGSSVGCAICHTGTLPTALVIPDTLGVMWVVLFVYANRDGDAALRIE